VRETERERGKERERKREGDREKYKEERGKKRERRKRRDRARKSALCPTSNDDTRSCARDSARDRSIPVQHTATHCKMQTL